MRIVSLVPDATEIAYELGLAEEVVGVTHECDWPPEARSKPAVVHTVMPDGVRSSGDIDAFVDARAVAGEPMYELDEDLLRELAPDLLLTQSLCDVCAVPQSLVGRAVQALGGRVEIVVLSPRTVGEMLADVEVVGKATGREARAAEIATGLRARIGAVRERAAGLPRPRTLVLEWLDPPWACGHWMPEMVDIAGGREMLGRAGEPSRRTTWDEVVAARPEAIVLAPCGFDVERTLAEAGGLAALAAWGGLPAVRAGNVWAGDANAFFSRPGPRLVRGVEILAACLHPEVFGAPGETEARRI